MPAPGKLTLAEVTEGMARMVAFQAETEGAIARYRKSQDPTELLQLHERIIEACTHAETRMSEYIPTWLLYDSGWARRRIGAELELQEADRG